MDWHAAQALSLTHGTMVHVVMNNRLCNDDLKYVTHAPVSGCSPFKLVLVSLSNSRIYFDSLCLIPTSCHVSHLSDCLPCTNVLHLCLSVSLSWCVRQAWYLLVCLVQLFIAYSLMSDLSLVVLSVNLHLTLHLWFLSCVSATGVCVCVCFLMLLHTHR